MESPLASGDNAVSLDRPLDGIQDKGAQLPISGTDKGIVVMSDIVPSMWSSMEAMDCRYHVLNDKFSVHYDRFSSIFVWFRTCHAGV
jgi:hypothetical protein